MGNFLALVPRVPAADTASLLRKGIDAARRLKGDVVASTLQGPNGCAAAFARRNGTASAIATDPASGSWLLAAGTWFHKDGYGSGAEARLLARYLATDALTLAREMDGFFCLVIGDVRAGEALVITDIVGSYHAFTRETDDAIAVSGSSLLLAGMGDVRLDEVGCHEFLHTGIVYEDRTCYAEVRKLGPASILRFRNGAPQPAQRYWHAGELSPESLDEENAVSALWQGLTRAARRVGGCFPHVVCDLTGGYDSRAMVAGFAGAGVAFSATVSGPGDSADVRVSRQLAKRLGVAHRHTPPGEPPGMAEVCEALTLTDGEYDAVEYARVARVHRGLMQQFDISVNGSFGELARGYWWELLMPRVGERRALDAGLLARRRFAAGVRDEALKPRASRVDLAAHFRDVVTRTNAGLEDAPNTLQMDHAYLRMRMQRWQGRIASSTNQLWPCLSLFMFREILETVMQTRSRLRMRSLLVRRLLARFSSSLANFPLEHGYPAAPLTWRNWYRFWPVIPHYAGRAVDKAARIAGLPVLGARSSSAVPMRLVLLRDPKVRETLKPARMRLSALIEEPVLARFLARAERTDFAYGDQWARVLTLECALRALEDPGSLSDFFTSRRPFEARHPSSP